MIDVRPLEADDVGEQRVRLTQRLVGGNVDRRPAVPAKCFERLVDELARFALGQSALGFASVTCARWQRSTPKIFCRAREQLELNGYDIHNFDVECDSCLRQACVRARTLFF